MLKGGIRKKNQRKKDDNERKGEGKMKRRKKKKKKRGGLLHCSYKKLSRRVILVYSTSLQVHTILWFK